MTPGAAPRPGRLRLLAAMAALLLAAVAALGLTAQPAVHTARAEIAFSPPESVTSSVPYLHYIDRLIEFSTTVSTVYNDRHTSVRLSSPRATLAGNGVRDGATVHPSMTGPQWRVAYDRPVVVVTVNAPSAEDALTRLTEAMDRLERISVELQDGESVDPDQRIATAWNAQDIALSSSARTGLSSVKGVSVLAVVTVLLWSLVPSRAGARARSGSGLPAPVPYTAPVPPERPRSPDAVTFLTIYIVLLCGIPSALHISALGSIGHPSTVWGLAGLAWWGYTRLARTEPGPALRSPVQIAFLVLVAAVGLAYAVATLRGAPSADNGLVRMLSWSGVFLVASSGIHSRRRLTDLLHRLVWAGSLMAVLGLAQFVTGRSFVDSVSLPGFSSSQDFTNVVDRGGFVRSAGTAAHPLEYGVLVAAALVLAIGLAVHARRHPWYVRWLPPLVLAVAASVSVSRSTLIAVALGMLLLLPSIPARYRFGAVALSGVLAVGLAFSVPGMIGTVRGLFTTIESDPSALSRTESFGVALEIAGRNPWTGQGFGTFGPDEIILDNQVLLLYVETGLLGAGAFLALVLSCLLAGWRVAGWGVAGGPATLRGAGGPWPLGAALAAAVAAASSTMFFFDGLSFSISAGLLFLLFGVTGAASVVARDGDTARTAAAPATTAPSRTNALGASR